MKGNEFAESSDSQSGVPGAAESISPASDVLDMQILGPHPPNQKLCFNSPLRDSDTGLGLQISAIEPPTVSHWIPSCD